MPAYIIRDEKDTPAEDLYQRVERMEEYKGRYLDTQEALLRADSRSLLVVVDTNRPEQVMSQDLLECCTRVAVIDHHRRAAPISPTPLSTSTSPTPPPPRSW